MRVSTTGAARPTRRAAAVLRTLPVAGIALVLAACGSGGGSNGGGSDSGPLRVVAGFYPLAYAAEQVGGNGVEVVNLTPPGGEAHDLELSPQQVAEVGEADLVLYIPGFQPALDEAIAQVAPDRALDVTQALDTLPGDPHVWLNPLNMATIGDEIAARLTDLRSDGPFTQGSTALTEAMDALNAGWTAGTAECRSRELVVSHEAFGYLAQQYDFAQIGIAGLTPDAEPSPARIAEVADLVRQRGITTIYYETLVDPKVAETLAAETGTTTAVLDPLEGLPESSTGNYVSIMQANLAQVRAGQGCT
jgi:zinc transport system substrate-binding protein